MAFMSQERKKQIKVELDKVLKPAKIKYSLGVRHHSTLVLNIAKAQSISSVIIMRLCLSLHMLTVTRVLRPVVNNLDLNSYHYRDHFTGEVKELLINIFAALNTGNHDHSDLQSDYFDVGWYVDVNIGKYNQPYVLTKGE